MRLPGRGIPSPIGIDVGSRSIEALQLRAVGTGWRLGALASLPRNESASAPTAEEIQRLAAVLFRQGFTGRRLVLACPPQRQLSGIIELPPRTERGLLDQIARMEFARIHKCDAHSFELAWWELPHPTRASKTTSAMAVACRHSDAESFLGLFESAGFDVARLDARPAACARACGLILGADAATAAILDIAWHSASLLIVREQVIAYERALPDAGVQTLHKSLTQQFELHPEAIEYLISDVGLLGSDGNGHDAQEHLRQAAGVITAHFETILKDLEASLTYARQQYDAPVSRLLVIGAGAAIPGLKQHLCSALGIEAQVVAPSDVVACPAPVPGSGNPLFTTALGLAMAGGD